MISANPNYNPAFHRNEDVLRVTAKRAAPKRLDWCDPDEVEAVVLAAFGFSHKCICEKTGVSANRLMYLIRRSGVKPTDYRNLRNNRHGSPTVGREIATSMLSEVKRRFTGVIRQRLPEPAQRPRGEVMGTIPASSR